MSCTEVSFVRFFLAGRYTAVVSEPQSTPSGTGMGIISWMIYVGLVSHWNLHAETELRSCVKVEVAILDSRP